jgi:hypothetical protein
MDPGHPGYRINHTIGSQVDLMPTILDSLGIALPTGQLYQGASLYSPNLNTNRTIYLNTFRQYGLIEGPHFITGDRETDKEGSANSRQVFEIANEDSHTTFISSPQKAQTAPSISAFDTFQKNVLRNYSAYSHILPSPEQKK